MAGVGTLEVGALIPGVTHPHRVPCHGELAEENATAMLELFGDPVANHGSGDYPLPAVLHRLPAQGKVNPDAARSKLPHSHT